MGEKMLRFLGSVSVALLAAVLNSPSVVGLQGQELVPLTPATVYYVSPAGDDSNPGSEARPWRTIQHSANCLAPGEIVYVRAGVYHEAVSVNVSGSVEGGYITFRRYPGETPILDGTGLSAPVGVNAILIDSQSYITIQGFEIRNYTTATPGQVPVGIRVTGSAHHIRLLNNRVHHIDTDAPVDADLLGADAHGVAVYGNKMQPLHDVLIDGNALYSLKLGSSEALALNGNVKAFTITHNLVHDCDNIGIDAIGYEGTAPDPSVDRARDGVISDNTIYNIDTLHNPAYGGERSAGGIYVDGGTRIVIERNRVYKSNIGVEIASEHYGRDTSYVTLRNNLVYNNHIAGIAMGGYDAKRGSTRHCAVVNNTLYHNDSQHEGNGELLVQFDVHDDIIENNIFYADDQGLLMSNLFVQNRDNVVDYNSYFSPAGADGSQWQWQNVLHTGFDVYRTTTGNDTHGQFAAPRFVDAIGIAPDLHLSDGSPAIDAGNSYLPVGEHDIDGEERIYGSAVDIGADEMGPSTRRTYRVFMVLVE